MKANILSVLSETISWLCDRGFMVIWCPWWLKRFPRHRNDLSVWRWILVWPDIELGWAHSSRTRKLICQRTERATTNLRLRTNALGEENSELSGIYVCDQFPPSFFALTSKTMPKQKYTYTTDLDLLRRILLCRSLRSFWGASVHCQIIFLVI